MRIKSIKEIEPKLSKCIMVDSKDRLFAVGGGKNNVLTHNSVAQQNIIIGCLLRPEHWVILGIDLKRVELSRYRKFGMKVATDLETAIEFLRFAQAVMMSRYELMESLGENNFKDLPQKTQALLVMIDEAGELLSPSGAKALSEFTIIKTPDGHCLMKTLKVGDIVLDAHSQPTRVTQKYEPIEQKRYKLTISDTNGNSESFVAGSEHLWVIQLNENGVTVEKTVDTTELLHLKQQGQTVRFRKYENK
jgi:hypothetical protein